MRLVGASSNFVRMPFLIETFLFNLLAVGVVAAIVLPTLGLVDPAARAFFGADIGVAGYFRDHGLQIFSYQFAAVTFLSLAATALSMRRYLRK